LNLEIKGGLNYSKILIVVYVQMLLELILDKRGKLIAKGMWKIE
jgi:hypothetical protein